MANITTRQTAGTGATVNNAPLTNTQLDTNFINLNTELVTHKYHSFTAGQYYFDNYEQGNYFRLFTENAVSDNTRFGAIQDVEYWDQTNLIWVSWGATGLAKVKALLDGRQDTSAPIDHANRKFRFTVTKNTGWPTKTIVVLQTTWSAISYTTATVSIEGSTQATGGTWTLRDTSVFSSANSGNNWGIHAKVTSSLHTGEVYNRITIDITDWVDSTTYTTYPLIGFSIYSNYSGSPQEPWSWNYDKVINFQAVPTVLNNPVLTSQNFNTYALPLTGGTISGSLTINSSLSATTTSTNIIKQPQGAVAGNTSTVGLNFSQYGNFYVTLSTNVTFTFDNLTNQTGSSGYIFLKQDGTGGRTITLPSVAKTPGGRALAQITTANSLSVITYYVVDTSTVIVNYIADFK